MSETVIVAIITGGVTLAGNLLANYSVRKKEAVERAKREQRFVDRLDRLERKVDEHNEYGRKFGEIEKAIVRIDTNIEFIKKGG